MVPYLIIIFSIVVFVFSAYVTLRFIFRFLAPKLKMNESSEAPMDKQICTICGLEISDDIIKCPRCNVRTVTKTEMVKRLINNHPVFTYILAAFIISPIIGWITKPLFGWVLFLILCFMALSKATPKTTIPTVTIVETPDDQEELIRQAETDKICDEIRDAIKDHAAAVKVLMALSRKDGTTSEAERRIVFAFLNRHGTTLTEERHWPYFRGDHAGEWQRAVTPEEIGRFCYPLKDFPQNYRIAVAAAAQAIVASGGSPKKSEQAALEIIQLII